MNGALRKKMGFITLTAILSSAMLLHNIKIGAVHQSEFHTTMLSRSSDHFAIKVFKLLAEKEKNVLFSPLSVLSALSMTYAGANHKTASQLKQALQMKLMHRNEILESFKQLTDGMRSDKNANISQQNAIFANEEFPFESKIVNEISQSFDAHVRNLNFSNEQAHEREINNFVRNITRGLIPELLPPKSVTSSNALYLVNVLHFQSTWSDTFPVHFTRTRDFYVTPTNIKQTQMMSHTGDFRCVEVLSLRSTMLELPFLGDRFAFYVILPNKKDGLQEVRKRLTYQRLEGLFHTLHSPYSIDVTLPKFNMTSSMNMKSVLMKLGVKKMFRRQRADFSRLDKTRSLFVDKVQQQVVLTIDEFGAEGAAASVTGLSSRSRPDVFKADHPFMFILRDKVLGMSLFMGQYTQPEADPEGLVVLQ